MCAIVGAVVRATSPDQRDAVNKVLQHIWVKSRERGRDGAGWLVNNPIGHLCDLGSGREEAEGVQPPYVQMTTGSTVIGNLRAEPTTEYVADKSLADQQPYSAGDWSIVHNGTIANDKALRTGEVSTNIDSAAIVEHLGTVQRLKWAGLTAFEIFNSAITELRGSFAILASFKKQPGRVFVAANYRPVWYASDVNGTYFASARHYFPSALVPQMLDPYSVAEFDAYGLVHFRTLHKPSLNRKALVVCSGGMDSVVAATYAQRLGLDVHLIHFLYGSRAEGPEVTAVKAVAEALGAPLTLFPLNVYSKSDSPLLDPDAKVAGGEAGAEFAHEWVPARNLVLLSVATAFAEARGIETIVLGNNLEEAGAYPDNEPEFIAKFNDLLPFAVGDGKLMRVIMPVGNMMKHEIVALGHKVGAPLHLTWSCYRAGLHHCGTCGPCYMRKKAFDINGLDEVIEYVPVN